MFTVGLFNQDHRLLYIDDKLVIAFINDEPTLTSRNGGVSPSHLAYALNMTRLQLKKGGRWKTNQEGLTYHKLEEQESEVHGGQSNARGSNPA